VSVLSVGVGARLILMPKFSPATAGQLLADRVSVMACVPTMLRSLAAEPPVRASKLRAILTGGEPLGEALTLSLGRTFPEAGIADLYGLTETGSCDFHLMPKDQPAGIGSIGVPTERVSYRIADAAEGIGGELQIKTPFGMLGYLDAPELTRTAFADGYFKTGDLARVRPDGRVELVGRAKDIISRGGYKIAPLEVEGVLAAHPDVAAVLCAGVPDVRLGECIHAVVVPRAGAAPDAQSIRAWAADRIEHYKLPDVIHLRESLPLGQTGKADRAAVATIAAQG
jgi:acyl-CoA synthetase (AMP-forming)/AMP-acid ligase II